MGVDPDGLCDGQASFEDLPTSLDALGLDGTGAIERGGRA